MIFLLLLLILPAVRALLKTGFFLSHDGEWMIIRLSDFHRSFVSGQIPVRWAARLNHQFGYPVFNFLYPLSLYLGEFFHLAGLDFIWSIKAVFIFSFFLSGIFMYLWIKEKWGRMAGLIAALIYVYAPYHLADVYVRGSLGEALAFVFPPLLFWQIEKASRRNQVIAGLAFAGLIMSHNTMALLFTGLLGFYLLCRPRHTSQESRSLPQHLRGVTTAIMLGLGLSCFFWLPALWDQRFVIFSQVQVSDFFLHFPSLKQLIIPSWGYGPSLPGLAQDQISFQIGIVSLLVGLTALIWPRKIKFWLAAFWLVFFFMLPVSGMLWRLFPVHGLIQFPWRLLALMAFISAVLAGFIIFQIRWKWQLPLVIFSGAFLIFQSFQYARPSEFINRPLGFYTTNEDTTTVQAEYTPIWVKEMPEKRASQKVEILAGDGEIGELDLNSKKISFQIDLTESSQLRINTHYFPGWQLLVNGQRQPIDYQSAGLIDFSLPAGQYSVMAVFTETPVRLAADLISFVSLLIALFLLRK